MKCIMQYIFSSLLIIAVAVGLYVSKGWNSTTALFPRVIGFPMLALLVVVLAVDIKRGRHREKNGETVGDGDMEFCATTCLTAIYFGWLIGFVVLVWAIGIVYSIPVYVFSYMKIQGKFSWLKSGIYAATATAFVVILFGFIFHMAWPEGAILSILGL